MVNPVHIHGRIFIPYYNESWLYLLTICQQLFDGLHPNIFWETKIFDLYCYILYIHNLIRSHIKITTQLKRNKTRKTTTYQQYTKNNINRVSTINTNTNNNNQNNFVAVSSYSPTKNTTKCLSKSEMYIMGYGSEKVTNN